MSEVAVIGGGVAGITCAAALSRKGMQVSLFEQDRSLLPLQRKNRTRFIHPNVVTWPSTTMDSATDLPFLNWHAGYSDKVAATIEREFKSDFVEAGERRIYVSTSTRVEQIERADGEYRLYFDKAGKKESRNFQAVFIASGFNKERKLSGFDNFSYWEDTSPIPLRIASENKVAIIGDGDGALSELIRCAWPEARLDEIYRFVAENFIRRPEIKTEIIRAEESARREWGRNDDLAYEILSKTYGKDCLTSRGADYLAENCNLGADITVIGKSVSPFSPKASPIHKILISFLVQKGFIKVEACKAESVTFNGDMYEVIGLRTDGRSTSLGPFNRVLERLGPEPKFTALISSMFDKSKLDTFAQENSTAFDFANPNLNEEILFHSDVHSSINKKTAAEQARECLESYFNHIYPGCISLISIVKGADGRPEFAVEYNQNSEFIRGDGPNVFRNFVVRYSKSSITPRALASFYSHFDNDGSAEDVTTPLAILRPGQTITNMSRPKEARKIGRITAFVRSTQDRNANVYLLTALHAIAGAMNDKIGVVSKKTEARKIGKLKPTLFESYLRKYGYENFKMTSQDVVFIEIDQKIVFENILNGKPIAGVRSSYEHFFENTGDVFIKNEKFGEIEAVKASVVIMDDEGSEVAIDGFVVKRTDKRIKIVPGSSGQLVCSEDNYALGMLLASSGDRVFCADLSDVFKEYKCVLA